MKHTTLSITGGTIGLAVFAAILFAPLVSQAQAETAGPKVSALESRIRDLEARMAKVEARVGEHESPKAGHAQHTGAGGMQGNMPDSPMGQMPPQHSMPPQSGQQQPAPMGGGGGGMGGMGDM